MSSNIDKFKASIPELQKEIGTLKNECTNVQKFLDIVKKYVCVQKLTPDVLRTFISKIVVHEREKSIAKLHRSKSISTSATSEHSLCRMKLLKQKKPNMTKGGQPELSAYA